MEPVGRRASGESMVTISFGDMRSGMVSKRVQCQRSFFRGGKPELKGVLEREREEQRLFSQTQACELSSGVKARALPPGYTYGERARRLCWWRMYRRCPWLREACEWDGIKDGKK